MDNPRQPVLSDDQECQQRKESGVGLREQCGIPGSIVHTPFAISMRAVTRRQVSAGQCSMPHVQVYLAVPEGQRHVPVPKFAQSPDLNLIENMWEELKHFIQTTVKPRNREELFQSIKTF